MPLIQPKWPVEPVIFYVVTYYATNEENADPVSVFNNMKTYDAALALAQSTITDNANSGVCTIQPVTASVVFPAIEWEDF